MSQKYNRDKMKKIFEYYRDDSRTQELLVNIKSIVDELDYNFNRFKKVIEDLALRIYHDKICEKDQISRIIKYLLADKIKEGKISAKWIEECLPKDYKRKYKLKSEDSSLSSQKPKTIIITNTNKEAFETNINSILSPVKNSIDPNNNKTRLEDTNTEKIKELQEIISKYEQMIVADQIFTENMQFIIPKEKFQQFKDTIEKCNKQCYLKFDKSKILREILSDN